MNSLSYLKAFLEQKVAEITNTESPHWKGYKACATKILEKVDIEIERQSKKYYFVAGTVLLPKLQTEKDTNFCIDEHPVLFLDKNHKRYKKGLDDGIIQIKFYEEITLDLYEKWIEDTAE